MRMRAVLTIAACALLAACGEARREDSELFIRDVPDRAPPIRPAPRLSDIRPVPDLNADRRALAIICNARGVDSPDVCGCVAREGAAEFRGRNLAYFAAHVIGDAAEIARLRSSHSDEERASLFATFGAIILRCGSRSLESTE